MSQTQMCFLTEKFDEWRSVSLRKQGALQSGGAAADTSVSVVRPQHWQVTASPISLINVLNAKLLYMVPAN